jgi:hypothetical protein
MAHVPGLHASRDSMAHSYINSHVPASAMLQQLMPLLLPPPLLLVQLLKKNSGRTLRGWQSLQAAWAAH